MWASFSGKRRLKAATHSDVSMASRPKTYNTGRRLVLYGGGGGGGGGGDVLLIETLYFYFN